MKKIKYIIFFLILVIELTGCNNSQKINYNNILIEDLEKDGYICKNKVCTEKRNDGKIVETYDLNNHVYIFEQTIETNILEYNWVTVNKQEYYYKIGYCTSSSDGYEKTYNTSSYEKGKLQDNRFECLTDKCTDSLEFRAKEAIEEFHLRLELLDITVENLTSS